MSEVWKPVPGYEGYVEASNLGRIKCLPRMNRNGRLIKGGIRKPQENGNGYKFVVISMDMKKNKEYVHRLVCSAFYGESDLWCDHLNGQRGDNRIENLEFVTSRENVVRGSICRKNKKGTSKYPGVHFDKRKQKYVTHKRFKLKGYNLGIYQNEEDAYKAYKEVETEEDAANFRIRNRIGWANKRTT